MVKSGALLLLLAVAVSQVDPSLSQITTITDSGDVDIRGCPIFYYGRDYKWLSVTRNPDSTFEICFTDGPGQTSQDCLVWSDEGVTNSVQVSDGLEALQFGTISSVPNILDDSYCKVTFNFMETTSRQAKFELYRIEGQTALRVFAEVTFPGDQINITAKVGGSELESWSWPKTELISEVYEDLTGCRDSGQVGLAGTEVFVNDTDNCLTKECSVLGEIFSLNRCGPFTTCEGNHVCTPSPLVCTVTGSSIIDFFGRVHTAPDRCAYSLVKFISDERYGFIVGFNEQRRKDVPLIDYIKILLPNNNIVLHQDGSVEVFSGDLPELTDTPQLFEGLELTKDETGITAKLPPSVSNMTISFDGRIARVSGFSEVLTGLCGSTVDPFFLTSLADEMQAFGAVGCEIQHSDDPDSTINCTIATERCNLLNEAPFTACHDRIDPEGFITSCVSLTCQYPMVDGLNCQFFEAYADACLLKDIPLEWRAQTGCSVREAFCPQYCSDHEFCGESLGERHCLCRATFASNYKATDSLGDPTVCVESSATLTLVGCLLAGKGIDYSTLHLNDPDCKGHMDEETHMLAFSFNSSNACGTEVLSNNSRLIYKNTITTGNSSDISSGIINRDTKVNIDFSCYYTEPEGVKSVSFKIKDSSVVKEIVSGVWNYTLMMNAYTDSSLVNLVDMDTEILLNQPVWVELKTEGLDEDMVAIVTDSCWATSQTSPDSSPRHDLVTDGCPNSADTTVSVLGNGLGTSNAVTFRMFEFVGEADEVYLHCMVELCPTLGQSCAPSCGGSRKRRAFRTKYAEGDAALITMGWNN